MAIRQFYFSLLRLVPLFRFNALSSKVCVGYCVGLDYGHWICLLNADDGFSSSKRILWCRANGFWYKANSSQLKIIFKKCLSIFFSIFRTNPKMLPLINWWPSITVSFSRFFVFKASSSDLYRTENPYKMDFKTTNKGFHQFLIVWNDSTRIYTRISNPKIKRSLVFLKFKFWPRENQKIDFPCLI